MTSIRPRRSKPCSWCIPPYAIVTRKSRGITEPKQLEGEARRTPTGSTFAQWPLFAKLNGIDVAKVTIENIGILVGADASRGQIDAALGYSYRLYVDLKDRGVPVDDIVLMPMANYGLKLYGNAVIVNPKFAAENPRRSKASCTPSCRVSRRRSGTRRRPSSRSPSATTRRNGRSNSSGCAWPSGQYRHARGQGERARRSRRRGSKNRSTRSGWSTPSRPSPNPMTSSTLRSCRRRPSAGSTEPRLVSGSARAIEAAPSLPLERGDLWKTRRAARRVSPAANAWRRWQCRAPLQACR